MSTQSKINLDPLQKNYSMQRFLSKGWFRACLSSRGWSSATNFVCLCLCCCFCCQSWLTSFLPSRKTTRQTDSFMLMRESKVGPHKKGETEIRLIIEGPFQVFQASPTKFGSSHRLSSAGWNSWNSKVLERNHFLLSAMCSSTFKLVDCSVDRRRSAGW